MFLISDLFQWVGRKALLINTTKKKGGNVQKSEKNQRWTGDMQQSGHSAVRGQAINLVVMNGPDDLWTGS
jgi:hypothetical protein